MREPDLEKLRRFSLTIALIVLTYAVAGISLEAESKLSVSGLSFKVTRPELLPIGLVLASLYGLVRFYYYGFMLHKSPFRIRREIIDGLDAWEPQFVPGKDVDVYFGPTEFETSPWYQDRGRVEEYVANFPTAFPKFARARVTAEIISSQSHTEDGEPITTYAAKIVIPRGCRISALFQDIDYATPVWLNISSLVVLFFTLK